jgi:hypothetical protein
MTFGKGLQIWNLRSPEDLRQRPSKTSDDGLSDDLHIRRDLTVVVCNVLTVSVYDTDYKIRLIIMTGCHCYRPRHGTTVTKLYILHVYYTT